MDALALLCNLYGDGPATLRRLREAGHGELAALARVSVDELAVLLGGSPVAARRFQSEAALLASRAHDGGEREPAEGAEHAVPTSAAPRPAHRDAVIERALAAWRVADAEAAHESSAASSELTDEQPEPVGAVSVELYRRESDEPFGLQMTPLRPALVDGLDDVTCARLRAAGVEAAEELVTADLLELSVACELPLTRLLRIQSHVKRLVVVDSPGLLVPHPRRSEARFSPDPTATLAGELRNRGRLEGESGSGPFA